MFTFVSAWWPQPASRRRRTTSLPVAFLTGCEVLEPRQVLSAATVGAAVAGPAPGSDLAADHVFQLASPIDAQGIILQRNADAVPNSNGVIPGLRTVKLPEGIVIHGIILQNGMAEPPPDVTQRPNGIYLLSEPVLARGLLVSHEVEGQAEDAPVKLEIFRFPKPELLRGIIPCILPGDTVRAVARSETPTTLPEVFKLPKPTTIDGVYVVDTARGSAPKLQGIPGGIASETIYGLILDGKPVGGKPVLTLAGEKITIDKPVKIKGFVIGPAPDGSGTPVDPSKLTMQIFDHAILIVGLHLKRV